MISSSETTKVIANVFAAIGVAGLLFGSCIGFQMLRTCNEAQEVANHEFGPEASLKKYVWFKDAAAQLDRKKYDINLSEHKLHDMELVYKDKERSDWPREDRARYYQWKSELDGIKMSFNSLAAEYNSNMAKINYKFANVGELPKGAENPLPREYKEYINK